MSGAGRIVAVTGARGFVGHALCGALAMRGYAVRALVRTLPDHARPDRTWVVTGNLERATEESLDAALRDVHAVVHLAGRAHVLDQTARDPDAAYHAANVAATVRLAEAAVRARVARLILASSVKVNGEATALGHPFHPDDVPHPSDAYARSKLQAETAVRAACAGASTVPLVVRLPLVYGPGVRGNMRALVDAVAAERRLPVGAIRNRRSLACIGNVTDAISAAVDAASAPTGVHFIADAGSVSTPDLVRAIAAALALPAHVVHVPVPLLRLAGTLTGRAGIIDRLANSLEVDASSFTITTRWQPRHTLGDGLAALAAWWRLRHAI
ncbi:MAG: NAD-dependent epimerase/dehydratase family protein [Casimicrobiaceae bacterium]